MKIFAKKGDLLFVVEEDLPDIGAYLYVYNQKNECTADYLQDDVISCKKQAFDLYGISYEDWHSCEE